MTDMAIDGDETCFEELAKVEWGEAGERYVRLNKAERARERLAQRSSLTKEQG